MKEKITKMEAEVSSSEVGFDVFIGPEWLRETVAVRLCAEDKREP